ncbi:MAG TPA: ribosomal protein S18-alanine N-acetyltransferase [Pyrinomonadaceae bacterium]|nr:ribosomal protein S18-alanine N-acetyltransferase [Pyrinomonadaceae bacterium]
MTEHDLLEVVEIEEHSGLSRWGWGAYYAELQGSNRTLMLVARIAFPQHFQYRIAGYIVARLAAHEIHINNVAVRPEYRRQGIGANLLNHVLEEGGRLKATTAFLEVRAGNSLAQALYKKCGFTSIGRRPGYYSTPPEDALIMSAPLSRVLDSGG